MNRDIKTGLITAALMIGGSFLLVALMHAGLVHGDRNEISTRGINVLIGLMTVGLASNGAKQLRRRLADLRDPALEQSLRRFSSWTLVIGGLIYAVAWLAAPFDLAFYVSVAGLGGSVLLVIGRCVMVRGRRVA